MGQKIFHHFEAPLVSFDEDRRLAGLATAGVYAGFDNMEVVGGNNMKITHLLTGIKLLNEEGTADLTPFGVVVTKQGLVVQDDTEFPISVPYITVNPRIDLIIAQHAYIDIPGGSAMVISLIQGAESTNPVPPSVSNPLIQVPIGYLKVVGTANHTLSVYIPYERKLLGGKFGFTKKSEKSLNPTIIQNADALQNSGFFYMDTYTGMPNISTNHWALLVFRKEDTSIGQLAIDMKTGRAFCRAADTIINGNVLTWKPWINLSNPDVPGVDFNPINAAIGNRVYTYQNYVTSGQSITESIDIFDQYLNGLSSAIDTLSTAYNNVATSIGSQNYTEQNILTNAESVTESLDKLDKSFGSLEASSDINNLLQPGLYATTAATANTPASGGIVKVFRLDSGDVIQEFTGLGSANLSPGIWIRKKTVSTWSAWFITKFPTLKTTLTTPWNMDTTITKTQAVLSLSHGNVLRVDVIINNNAGTVSKPLIGATPGTPGANEVSGSLVWDDTNLVLSRTTGGIFDDASYNAATADIYITFKG